jgi:hypothetical protein
MQQTENDKLMTTTTQVKTSQHFNLIKLSTETKRSIADLHREALDLLLTKYKTQ